MSAEKIKESVEICLEAAYKRNVQTGEYEYLSLVFSRISGYTPEEMRQWSMETLAALIHPEDQAKAGRVMAESQSGASGASYQLEYRFRHKDGQYRCFHDQFTVVRDAAGQLVARVGSVSDITGSRRC